MNIIEIENLSHRFNDGTIGIKRINLGIREGSLVVIVGHNGSGKTTLISIVGGILKPTSGRVLLDGTDICTLNDEQLSEYRVNRIGFMFQFASLLPILTARENVLLPSIFNPGKNKVDEKYDNQQQ